MRPESRLEMAEVLAGGATHAVVEGDAVAGLYELPEASVDLLFADPPYNLSNGGTTNRGGKRVSVDKGQWDASRGLVADQAFHSTWLAAAQRALKPSGTIWVSGTQHAIFAVGWSMQVLGFHLLNTITWFKPNASPHLACRMFTHSTELLVWAAPAKADPLAHHFAYDELKAENGDKQVRDVWALPADNAGGVLTIPAAGAGERQAGGKHPTQKPRALLERIVRAASRPGDLVVDPFSGSSTTGDAAVRLERRFIGFDIDAAFVASSRERLTNAARRRGRTPTPSTGG